MSSWIPLGTSQPRELTEARLELHHAAQLVSIAIGRSLLPPREDDSHTALTWLAGARQWIGQQIPDSGGLTAGLRPEDLTLTFGRRRDPAAHRLALAGKTRADGLAWLREQLADFGQDADAAVLDFHYEMPHHPVENGAAFRSDLAPGFQELARWFANGVSSLSALARGRDDASPVLTWPHHFDAGLLLPEGAGADGESRTVGVGLSPGDDSYDEPYFYVNAWPSPETDERPALPCGHWHTEGFFAAILTATELLDGGGGGQKRRASEFLEAAVEAARRLLR